MDIHLKKRRQRLIFFAFCGSFILVLLWLFKLQIIDYPKFKKKAENQHKTLIQLKPRRGTIYDTKGSVFALDTPVKSVYAVPREISDKENVAAKLSSILSIDRAFVLDRINRDKLFIWIKRKVTDKEALAIDAAKIKGVGLRKETKRSYPNGIAASQLVGFTDMDNNGIDGLELQYNSTLKGREGYQKYYRDAKQKLFSFSYEDYMPPKQGNSLVLTIDDVIQNLCEQAKDDIVKTYHPNGVMIIAMDPYTGAILAMANYPTFDPNDYKHASKESFKNRCIVDSFEPGSVYKVITASALVEENAVNLNDRFYCENGNYAVGKRILHDYHPYGTLTFREVIEKSSNIGTVKAASKIGQDKLFMYIKKFGFGEKTGVNLSGEENGIIRSLKTWTPSDMTTVPMGQGISVTALQLAAAISTIANGGLLMKPYVIKKMMDKDGNILAEFKPEAKRRVISEKTSATVRNILGGVIEKGTGTKAKLANYSAGGKTGTAQKVGSGGRYAEGKFVASFIGFAPCRYPKLALVVCVDEPKGNHFGGVVSAPAFKKIMDGALSYMEVRPDDRM